MEHPHHTPVPAPMVHWAGSYGLVALVAWLMVLAGHAGAWSIPALAIAALCAMLALLALFTHAFERGRDGLYSFERAFALTACAALIIAGTAFWEMSEHRLPAGILTSNSTQSAR